jgi:lysophospholipase L1-like esterase
MALLSAQGEIVMLSLRALCGLPLLFCTATVLPAPPPATALQAGAHYVAMGSSFGAGPGIASLAPDTPPRCARSTENYAHQLARRRGLVLSDATCSGATTAHVLGAWNELPAQLDALRPETRLVTLTIGGNDVGYIGSLRSATCKALSLGATIGGPCESIHMPDAAAWKKLRASLRLIVSRVRARSPQARLVFVDYATILPPGTPCSRAPMSDADAGVARRLAARLAQITADVARESGADLLAASKLTRDHHACAADPWMNGMAAPGPDAPAAPFHPKLAGMTAVADALDRLLAADHQGAGL